MSRTCRCKIRENRHAALSLIFRLTSHPEPLPRKPLESLFEIAIKVTRFLNCDTEVSVTPDRFGVKKRTYDAQREIHGVPLLIKIIVSQFRFWGENRDLNFIRWIMSVYVWFTRRISEYASLFVINRSRIIYRKVSDATLVLRSINYGIRFRYSSHSSKSKWRRRRTIINKSEMIYQWLPISGVRATGIITYGRIILTIIYFR